MAFLVGNDLVVYYVKISVMILFGYVDVGIDTLTKNTKTTGAGDLAFGTGLGTSVTEVRSGGAVTGTGWRVREIIVQDVFFYGILDIGSDIDNPAKIEFIRPPWVGTCIVFMRKRKKNGERCSMIRRGWCCFCDDGGRRTTFGGDQQHLD